MVACGIRYDEHASSAKDDLAEAKGLVKNMCEDYGMCSSLLPKEEEQEVIMKRLYGECKTLLERLINAVNSVESVLYERESITKNEVKKYINEVL